MIRLRMLLILITTPLVWIGWAAPARAVAAQPPVAGPIVRAFDPPDQPWLAGHRGIDLAAPARSTVVATMSGRVSFVGQIAGVSVIVVDHGSTRTTYQPVTPTVEKGDLVGPGEQLGLLLPGHGFAGRSCLHLGWLRGDTYLDPAGLFDPATLRLLPHDGAELAARLAALRAAQLADGSPGLLIQPVPGRIGSRFGMRKHPIFHVWRMHSGVDIGAACRTPISAAEAGVVIGRSYDPASGNRLTIDHGLIGGHHLVTVYLHASGYSVGVGQRVRRGQHVGRVGSTGWSTGCHLHFSVKVDGRLVDPQRYL